MVVLNTINFNGQGIMTDSFNSTSNLLVTGSANYTNTAALVKDLKAHGLLDDTLVVWGGEFGRTNY